jgi:catechol 2,3-dioxygenase-like lactoylglutathione lyase family enzyme
MKMTGLVPMLPVHSMAASVEFYAKLGFAVENRNDGWGWAMLRFDDPDGNRLWVGKPERAEEC